MSGNGTMCRMRIRAVFPTQSVINTIGKQSMGYAVANKDNPSGLKLKDMCLYVHQKIYVLFRGSQNAGGGNKTKEFLEEDMPTKCFPNGWFSFVMFGPMAVAGFTFGCLSEEDTNVKKIGRDESRKKELEQKKREHEAGVGGYVPSDYTRGSSIGKKAEAAFLAQSELEKRRRRMFLGCFNRLIPITPQRFPSSAKSVNSSVSAKPSSLT